MIEQYKKELKEIKISMKKAEAFAKRLPLFSKTILDEKLSGEESYMSFGDTYKNMYIALHIQRGLYEHNSLRNVTNYDNGHYKEYLFCIYINTFNIYNSHEEHGLGEVKDKVDLFFYDKLNTTFYVNDDNIEKLLDALCLWRDKALKKRKIDLKADKITDLKKQLKELESND